MGKTARIKGDLDDVEELLEIISILKDVATNRFFAFAKLKEDLAKFLEIFLIFFNMLESVETDCPLVRNKNVGTDIVVATSESSFMTTLNNRVCFVAAQEYKKYPESRVLCLGWRGAERCKQLGMRVDKLFRDISDENRYYIALELRDYLIERCMSGESGRAICVHILPKSFNILKPRVVKLLPAEELLGGGPKDPSEMLLAGRDFIAESSIDGIMKVLADIWISSRLLEMISDTKLAEAAAQSQQLEQAIEGLSREKKDMTLAFKKSMRDDLNKAMREVFSSSQVVKSGGRR